MLVSEVLDRSFRIFMGETSTWNNWEVVYHAPLLLAPNIVFVKKYCDFFLKTDVLTFQDNCSDKHTVCIEYLNEIILSVITIIGHNGQSVTNSRYKWGFLVSSLEYFVSDCHYSPKHTKCTSRIVHKLVCSF